MGPLRGFTTPKAIRYVDVDDGISGALSVQTCKLRNDSNAGAGWDVMTSAACLPGRRWSGRPERAS
jgi:hypothetical protein